MDATHTPDSGGCEGIGLLPLRDKGHELTGIENLATSPLETYRSYLRQEKLAYQFSAAAQRAVFFPRLVCPFTGSTALEWRVSAGRGQVHATTVVYPREGLSYNVAMIELDEGFRMMSRVEGLAPSEVAIGQRVCVRFVELPDEPAPLPVFVVQEEAVS